MICLEKYLNRFYFEEAPPERPAILRVLVGVWVLYYLGKRYRMLVEIAASDGRLFRPVGVVSRMKKPAKVGTVRALYFATMISAAAFALGFRHRTSGPAFASLLLWLLSYRNSWSMIFHTDNGLVLHAIVLGFSRSADALSVDALLRDEAAPEPHWRYGWPARLVSALTVLTYFVAGVAKFAGPLGRSWTDGEEMRAQIGVDALRKDLLGGEAGKASPLVAKLYRNKSIFRAAGFGSLVLEVCAPLFLLDKRLARLWAAGAFAMHWGIFAMMKIKFRYQMSGLIFASFLDLDRLWKQTK
ncbi:HTTM domain-containing protein [Rubrobacter indicoceani]|uniref:HTTM domain-containing protein n=1 Tax=Rubrobacter indicoceani TaxID=2051957 RepID=UPI000E5A1738|nr:HTTM domain-containing protein [Rubrobacter indicoceani]